MVMASHEQPSFPSSSGRRIISLSLPRSMGPFWDPTQNVESQVLRVVTLLATVLGDSQKDFCAEQFALHDPMFICLDSITACDRQMDGQTRCS